MFTHVAQRRVLDAVGGPDIPHEGVSRIDAYADVQVDVEGITKGVALLVQLLEDLHAGFQRPQFRFFHIVRGAEDREDRVTEILVDQSAPAFYSIGNRLVKTVEKIENLTGGAWWRSRR